MMEKYQRWERGPGGTPVAGLNDDSLPSVDPHRRAGSYCLRLASIPDRRCGGTLRARPHRVATADPRAPQLQSSQ